jgi:hypothetical protein
MSEYKHLRFRADTDSRQMWLKGRNLSVGHLVATIRVNGLTPEDAAEDLDLPIGHVLEALVGHLC